MDNKKDKHLYDENSIESLDPLQFTRLRPQVYAGDCTYSTQLLVEIISNAVDEYRLGHGSQINVTIDKDIVTVQDYGQGFIPNSFRDDGTYEGTSLGSFGIGSKITTFLSHWLEVVTWRKQYYEKILFKEGIFEERNVGFQTSGAPSADGTKVSWQPSEEFFTHTEVEINKIRDLFKTIVCLCPGLTINLNNNGKEEHYISTRGLHDLIDEAVGDKEIINNRFSVIYNEPNGKNKLDIALTYTSNYSSTIVPYVNTGLTESGPHITQIKTIITREFNKFFKEKKWLKEKDANLTGDDIQEGMYVVFNITAPNVGYDAQVKSRITKIDMTPFTSALSTNLEIWLNNNEKEIKGIFEKAVAARKARDAAKKARDKAREQNKKKQKALKFDSKLADCWSKDRMKCEIYVTEGK